MFILVTQLCYRLCSIKFFKLNQYKEKSRYFFLPTPLEIEEAPQADDGEFSSDSQKSLNSGHGISLGFCDVPATYYLFGGADYSFAVSVSLSVL